MGRAARAAREASTQRRLRATAEGSAKAQTGGTLWSAQAQCLARSKLPEPARGFSYPAAPLSCALRTVPLLNASSSLQPRDHHTLVILIEDIKMSRFRV